LPYFTVTEPELTLQLLEGRRVLWLLGDSKNLNKAARECVDGFAGKVLTLDDVHQEGAHMPVPGDAAHIGVIKRLGEASPALWDVAVQRAIARAGEIAGYASADAAIGAIHEAASDDPARQAAVNAQLERAAELRTRAAE